MMNPLIMQKIFEMLVMMNTAMTNLRLYPPASAMITNAMDKLYQTLLALFEENASIIFAEAEQNLLINGEALNKMDLEKPHVKVFLELLLYYGIRSITFEKGIEQQELTSFLKIAGEKRETIRTGDWLQQRMADSPLPHIHLDQKLYIAKDGDQQIMASLDIRDDDIIQYMIGSNPDLRLDAHQLREMANDPEWVAQIFEKGMNQIMQQKKLLSSIELSENLIRMIGVFENILNKIDHDMFSLLIGKTFANLDSDIISLIMTFDIDHLFSGRLFQDILENMNEEKFTEVVARIQIMGKSMAATTASDLTDDERAFQRIYSRLMASEMGMKLKQDIEEKQTHERDEREKRHQALKEKIEIFLGGEKGFPDDQLMASLPDLVDQLAEYGDHESFDALIRHLEQALLSNGQPVRDQAAAALSLIIERLPQNQQTAFMDRLSGTLVKWIKMETSATSAYKNICQKLKDRIGDWIAGKNFDGCLPALDVFHLINAGILDKNETAHAIASGIIGDLASPERMALLFEAFGEKEGKTREDAGRVLARLGDAALNRLLDMLRDQEDSTERIRILHLLIEIGQPTISLIRERLDHDEPWYFLRNLVYVLGRINNQQSVELLGDFLLYKHEQVRQEALQSIQRVGGNQRGPVLLSVLPRLEESFQVSVIQELGNAKYTGAVPMLLELLKKRPLLPSPLKTELDENICIALGRIGSQEAVPLLTEISRQKSFFMIKPYPDKVKMAAAKALASIRK